MERGQEGGQPGASAARFVNIPRAAASHRHMREHAKIVRLATVLVVAGVATVAGCASANGAPVPGTAPLTAEASARELTPDEQARHVLDRLAFGARPGDIEQLRKTGVDAWISAQLHPERIAANGADDLARSLTDPFTSPSNALRDLAPNGRADTNARRMLRQRYAEAGRAVQTARLVRAVGSDRQLQETLVDLWANHFSVFAGKGPVRLYLAQYEEDAIRPHVLGKFRDLLGAVAHSPAMLFYLDNWQSVADSLHPTLAGRDGGGMRVGRPTIRAGIGRRGLRRGGIRRAPVAQPQRAKNAQRATAQRATAQGAGGARRPRGVNENYARELMELHTLGVDGGYTQRDVIEVARAFTGWSIAAPRAGGGFVFRSALHDAGEKHVLGQTIRAGGGEEDGEQVLDILARSPATARMVATTLARRLVSDDPPASVIDRAIAAYTRTDGDLREVVRTIVTSPEFFSRAAFRAKVKSPLELVASAVRAAGIPADTTPRLARAVAQLGEPLYGHQTPNGWPERSTEWLSAGSVADRVNFIAMLTARPQMGDSIRTVLESPDFQRR
jgi:uncharacterized protein (DUF1800 family)